jgi:ubiquinone/menaquinone biosynthesis C-methylase UbiE
MSNLVYPLKMTAQGTFFGKRFLPLTSEQILFEETWETFLNETLGPEMLPEEREALERALKKFKGISKQRLENPYFWESWAPNWAEYSRKNLSRGMLLLNRLGCIRPDLKIISLGAGSCWQEVFLARYYCPRGMVFGVDFSHHMIKQGTQLARREEVKNVRFMVGKMENIPLPENMGDLVISLNVLDLIPEVPKVLGEIKRILCPPPRGRYFLVFPLDPGNRLQPKAEAWHDLIVRAGLEEPILFCLTGKNYKGKSLRLLGLTNFELNL